MDITDTPCYMLVTNKENKLTRLLPLVITMNIDTSEVEKSNCVMFSNN